MLVLARMHKRKLYSLLAALAFLIALGIVFFLRVHAPPEVARLLPECDGLLYLNLKSVRAVTHFDQKPLSAAPEYRQFTDATGFRWDRDLDRVAVALHRMDDPRGPNGPVAYSAVLEGRFDTARLTAWLKANSRGQETYQAHTVYTIPAEEGRIVRVAVLGYDVVAATNTPSTEQIHSILDRYAAGASPFSGSSVLAAYYREVPYFSFGWGIGHIGLPFSENGRIQVFGVTVPVAADTDLIASLTYLRAVHLRVEVLAPTEADAASSADALNGIATILKAFSPRDGAAPDQALRKSFDSLQIVQKRSRVVINADIDPQSLESHTSN